jgi:hypothetical protein
MEIRYNIKGQERKNLVTALVAELNQPVHYEGAPGFGYSVGENYRVDRDGTLTGPDNRMLVATLAAQGFQAEQETYDAPPTETAAPEAGVIAIEVPLPGEQGLENLRRMVEAKAELIKMAIGAAELPIEVLEDRVSMPWFRATEDSGLIGCYAQFITRLAATAREKKRVTAKAPENFENPAFSLRMFLIQLGMSGDEYKAARRALGASMPGNSAWRFGPPEKAAAVPQEDASAAISAEEAPSAEETAE